MGADGDRHHEVLTLASARRLVESGAVDLLTSDVFDTLVWRPVSKPHQLFPHLAARLRDDGLLRADVDAAVIGHGRRRAERLARDAARRTRRSVECTIEEIWGAAPAAWFAASDDAIGGTIDDRLVARLVTAELAVEAAALRPHPTAVGLLRAARDRGVAVCLVSDSYLSPDQLRQLLTDVGVDVTGIDVVTSSSVGVHKWEGLLERVLADRGTPRDRCLHVGDHPLSDVEVGLRAGVRVARAAIAEADDCVPTSHAPWVRHATATATDGGREAVVRETLLRAGDRGLDASYQFGAAVAGPVMAGFCQWVDRTAAELGAGAVHCLLREGARIADLIGVVRPQALDRVLVHASRWGVMRATVFEGSTVELERALERRQDFTAAHVTAAFGVPQHEVERVIGTAPYRGWSRIEAWDAIAADDALRGQIVESSARLRAGVRSYLERTLRLDDGALVLCDIGWGGRIQEGITAVLRETGFAGEVVGLYSMLSPAGDERNGAGHRLLGYMPTVGAAGMHVEAAAVAIRNCEFLERINTPAIGTLLEFTDAGDPVCRPDDHDRIPESLRAAQDGVEDFCRTLAEVALPEPAIADEWSSGRLAGPALEALAAVVAAPDRRVAAALTTWEHDDVAGDDPETLAHPWFDRWARFGNVADLSGIEMNEMFWIAGAAAASSPALAAQFAAVAGGADPTALCPPSATGRAIVAAFPPGSPLASAQTQTVPRTGADGWMLLRLDTPMEGLRSVRIDLGDTALLAEIGDVEVVVTTTGGATSRIVDGVDQLDQAVWVGRGGWIGRGRCVAAPGAHLVVDVPTDLAPRVTRCRVSIGYRAWPVDDAQLASLLPRWRSELHTLRRKAGARLRR
jgi:FMN phosphatase YigB (HAD superfamily)